MKSRTAFIIFAHSTTHTNEDVDDMIANIYHIFMITVIL